MTLHDDMDPNKAYGGISGLWVLPADHPFNRDFQWHDQQYDLARTGEIISASSENVDLTLLARMLKTAGNDRVLRLEAYFFFELCQVWGRWLWPDAALPENEKFTARGMARMRFELLPTKPKATRTIAGVPIKDLLQQEEDD